MSDLNIPDNAVILNELRVLEFLDPDGEIYKMDLSSGGDGQEISFGKALELIEWARAFQMMPFLADLVLQYTCDEDEDGV